MSTKLPEAMAEAAKQADRIGLPLTIYKAENTCGWWFTNSLSAWLRGAKLHATVLPFNYFA